MLYLMRHGQAGNDFPDEIRALTSRGEKEVLQVAKFLQSQKTHLCALWHSPLTRACQTANIVGNVLKPKNPPQIKSGFSPNDSAQIAVDAIEEFFIKVQNQNLFIVSHLPLLPQIVELMIGKNVSFQTSNCLVLLQDEKKKWIVHDMIRQTS